MSKTAEEIKTEIAEKLNLLSLHTHTYNVDDCLDDVMSIISSQQKTECFEWLKDHEIAAESGVGYINDTRGSLNFQLGAKWAQSELQERFNSTKLKTSELEKENQELRDIFDCVVSYEIPKT